MAYAFDSAERTVNAEDEWATVDVPVGLFEFYVRGTYVATISLQFSPDGGTTWLDRITDLATELGVTSGVEYSAAAMKWRLGVKTSGFVSGTAICRIFGGVV